MNIILKQGAVGNNWSQFYDGLKSKTDIIVNAANQVMPDPQNVFASTLLLNSASTLPVAECTVGMAILLSVQADNLPAECHDFFLHTVRQFVMNATKEQALLCHKEGKH